MLPSVGIQAELLLFQTEIMQRMCGYVFTQQKDKIEETRENILGDTNEMKWTQLNN